MSSRGYRLRKDTLDHLELVMTWGKAVRSEDPLPVLSDLDNTTGRTEVAVFLDAKYPDMDEVRASLLRGKEFGARHVIPATASHTLELAEELGLDVLKAELPAKNPPRKFGPWKARQKRLHKKLYYAVQSEWIDTYESRVATSTWRRDWVYWLLVARCDHIVVFRRPGAHLYKDLADKVEEYPHLEERIHIFTKEGK